MNPIHMAQVGIRLVAIYLIAIGISRIPQLHQLVTTYDPIGDYTRVLIATLVSAILSPAIIGGVLWLVAPKLSTYVITSYPTSSKNSMLNINQFQSSVVVLIGVYLLANYIPTAVSTSYQFFYSTIEVNGKETYQMIFLPRVMADNLKVVFGIILIIGSKLIVRGITKIRTMGSN